MFNLLCKKLHRSSLFSLFKQPVRSGDITVDCVLSGSKTERTIDNLSPGQPHVFRLQAWLRADAAQSLAASLLRRHGAPERGLHLFGDNHHKDQETGGEEWFKEVEVNDALAEGERTGDSDSNKYTQDVKDTLIEDEGTDDSHSKRRAENVPDKGAEETTKDVDVKDTLLKDERSRDNKENDKNKEGEYALREDEGAGDSKNIKSAVDVEVKDTLAISGEGAGDIKKKESAEISAAKDTLAFADRTVSDNSNYENDKDAKHSDSGDEQTKMVNRGELKDASGYQMDTPWTEAEQK